MSYFLNCIKEVGYNTDNYKRIISVQSVQLISHVPLFATPWTAAHQVSLFITNSQSLPKFMFIVSDVMQPFHALSSPSPPTFNLSQYQGLFWQLTSLHQVAKVSELQFQPSIIPMNIQDWFPLGWTGWISLQSKELSRVFSNDAIQKHPFLSTQLSL